MRLSRLRPATVNDRIYKPIAPDDPAVRALAESIRQRGILEPLVITLDEVILSGHRRYAAAQVAGLSRVPVRRHPVYSTDPDFEVLLVSFNEQRVKTTPEAIREQVIRTSPDDAHNALLAHRKVESAKAFRRAENAGLCVLKPGAAARRSEITSVKRPMLDAAVAILQQYRDYWPLTLRQIHYRMLTRNVIRNTKLGTVYANNTQSYKDLSDLLTRARLDGEVPWEGMHDPTRPRTTWQQWDDVGSYVRGQIDSFLCGYRRNLLQSQTADVELVVEKITVQEIAERAASYYHVPVGVGRGYTSVTSLDETADRFRASGKDRFVLLIAGDLDPEGENICQTWAACMRDEHGVDDITPVKVGVNPDQVERYSLAPLPIKESSSRAAGFKKTHGGNVYELEAFEPAQLQTIIRDAIRDVLDLEAFAEEQRKESEDARYLMAYRSGVRELIREDGAFDMGGAR
jgi:hypothetical protein